MAWQATTYTSKPMFIADYESIDLYGTGGQIDWARVPDTYRTGSSITVTTTAAAAALATSIAVTSLTAAIPSGTILDFTGPGELARLTADAAVGATTLTVEPLDAAIESGDTATFYTTTRGPKAVKAGTVLSQLTGGKFVPRVARPGTEPAIGVLISTAIEGERTAALSGYGIIIGGVLYGNLLTGANPEGAATYLTELNANGTGWVLQTYADSTEI